ncbi:MAG: ABC transporter ATP-binding protein [Thermoanaerobaculum sp.]|nr:ABC transporter ATP-binding protein [Thermoanaerobaculum sp.]
MSDKAILLEEVWLRYRVPEERIQSLKEFVIRRAQRRLQFSEFWALRQVSITVAPGEVLGVVGRNGAGKTTLMKLIAQVLRPTRGRVRVWGRVAPLLGLGAGFHEELTGRENIFLASSLLGYSRREVATRLDRIVAFAELEEFIDRPLRTYSSGMRARLGFAVATDVPPDILILDEVLAVGDAAFQQKCHERIQAFRRQGATVIIVSHQAPTVGALCSRALLLDAGRVVADGESAQVLQQYQALLAHQAGQTGVF